MQKYEGLYIGGTKQGALNHEIKVYYKTMS